MLRKLSLLGLIVFSSLSFGYSGPILSVVTGGMDGEVVGEGEMHFYGPVTTCTIYATDKNLKKTPKALFELTEKASKEKIEKAVHMMRTVPSVEIMMTRVLIDEENDAFETEGLLLLEDSTTVMRRSGKYSEELINLALSICQ